MDIASYDDTLGDLDEAWRANCGTYSVVPSSFRFQAVVSNRRSWTHGEV